MQLGAFEALPEHERPEERLDVAEPDAPGIFILSSIQHVAPDKTSSSSSAEPNTISLSSIDLAAPDRCTLPWIEPAAMDFGSVERTSTEISSAMKSCARARVVRRCDHHVPSCQQSEACSGSRARARARAPRGHGVPSHGPS